MSGPQKTSNRRGVCIITEENISVDATQFVVRDAAAARRDILTRREEFEGCVVDAQLPKEGIALAVILHCIVYRIPLAVFVNFAVSDKARVALLMELSNHGALITSSAGSAPPQRYLVSAAYELYYKNERERKKAITDTVRSV